MSRKGNPIDHNEMAGQERSLVIQVNVLNKAAQLPRFYSHQRNNLASLSPPLDMARSPVF